MAYALLLAALLLAPVALGALHRPTRREVYREMSRNGGDFAALERETFDRTGDVEMLFVGDSTLWAGIDTPKVEAALKAQHGPDAKALTLACNWQSGDMAYVFLRDFFARRRAKTIFFHMPTVLATGEPHPYLHRFWVYGDDPSATVGLPLRDRAMLYASTVLGAPRHMVGLLRPNRIEPEPAVDTRGTLLEQKGFDGAPFELMTKPPPPLSAADGLLSPATAARYRFANQPIDDYQIHFFRLAVELAKRNGARVGFVNIPLRTEAREAVALERLAWGDVLGTPMPLVGIPGERLFAGLSEEEVDRLFYNGAHFNVNGSAYFTTAILPALMAVHDAP